MPSHAQDEPRNVPIGRILVSAKRLQASQVDRVLEAARRRKLPFGEAALQLGLIKRKDIDFALARQFAFPYLDPDDASISTEIIAAYAPGDPTVEQLRALRGQIAAQASDDPNAPLRLAIVSPEPGDGRSFTAANLAVVYAQLGRPTLLIDASLRTACLHRWFEVDNGVGLSTFLAERAGLECLRAIPQIPGLHVLPSGPVPPNSLELLERPRCEELLRELGGMFEVIVIDTPAGSVGNEGPLLARRAGSALIVARSSRTRFAQARAFALKLEQARTRVLGVVFNERR